MKLRTMILRSPDAAEGAPAWAKALSFEGEKPAPAAPPTSSSGQPAGSPAAPPAQPPVAPTNAPVAPTGSPVPAAAPSVAPGSPGAPTGNVAPPPILMDQATVQQLIAGVTANSQPQQQTPPPTQEELDKMFNVFKVTPQLLTEQLGIENPTEAQLNFYNNLAQGAARQAATIASMAIAMEVKRLQDQYAPFQAFVEQQQQAKLVDMFFGKYPNLKGYEPLLSKVRDSYLQQGRKFKNEDEAFKTIAEDTVAILRSTPGVDVSKLLEGTAATPNGAAPQQPQPNPTRMPTLSGGGQGGAGDANKGDSIPNWKKALS